MNPLDTTAAPVIHLTITPAHAASIRAVLDDARARWEDADRNAAIRSAPAGRRAEMEQTIDDLLSVPKDLLTEYIDDLLTPTPAELHNFWTARVSKEGCVLAARWVLLRAQDALWEAAADAWPALTDAADAADAANWLLRTFPLEHGSREADLNEATMWLRCELVGSLPVLGHAAAGVALGAGAAWLARFGADLDLLLPEFGRSLTAALAAPATA